MNKQEQIKQYLERTFEALAKVNPNFANAEKKQRANEMFLNAEADFEIVRQKIDKTAQQMIDDFIKFQKMIEGMMKKSHDKQLDKVATLNLNTEKNGIYLSQQQIDLLMITELSSKEALKEYVEKICGQFPYMSVESVIPSINSIELEEAKRILYQKYQDGLISYLDNAQMNDVEKAKVKLERLGIKDQELEMCLSQVAQGKINEIFTYLGQKYGTDFITKFNRYMNDDFENIKGISYDEMKSLSELISRDETMDTIIIATGKYRNSIYPSLTGEVFDPYLTQKGLEYCARHNKHMRYHTLFDQAHIEHLLKQGKGIQDHDQILEELRAYVKMSMEYIEKNNRQLPDGTMLINTVEIFNELVEKNKSDKNSPYAMVWEKHFGITLDEILSCFDGIKKPDGVEFMYNETTLTESPHKREMVEQLMFQIEQRNPNLIDSFGDQMHLSDEDVITEEGKQNLMETAQMIERIQKGQIMVDGQIQDISPKKTECTEHDFHFSKSFLENVSALTQMGQNVDLWSIKREIQSEIEKTYMDNGVNFDKCTYWSLFGQCDHNIVRANISIQRENEERQRKGLLPKPLIDTMSAGLIPDSELFTDIKSLKKNSQSEFSFETQNLLDQAQEVLNQHEQDTIIEWREVDNSLQSTHEQVQQNESTITYIEVPQNNTIIQGMGQNNGIGQMGQMSSPNNPGNSAPTMSSGGRGR